MIESHWGISRRFFVDARLRWTELGPLGYLPQEPATLLPALEARGLGVAGSFLFQPLHDPSAHDATLDMARRTCRPIGAAGGSHLVVLDSPATIEQDRRPGARRTPLEDLADSVAFLRAQGLDAA